MLRFLCRLTASMWAAWLAWRFVGELTRGDPQCLKFRLALPASIKIGKVTVTRDA